MKKVSRVLIISLLIIITLSTIILLNKNTSKNKSFETSKMISVMYQDENGAYHEGDSTKLTKDGYRFNARKSSCENGGTLSWNKTKEKIETSLATTDRCYAYFDNNKYVEDLSGNGNHGQTFDIVSWDNDGLTTSNESKKGYINCGLANYDFGESISLVIKYKFNTFNSSYTNSIFSSTQGVGIALAIAFNPNPKVFIHMYTQTTQKNDIGAYFNIDSNINVWHTMVVTYDGKYLSFYDNGTNIGQAEASGKLIMGNYPFLIGADPSTNPTAPEGFSSILVKQALIFNRALTADEIAKDYADEINPTNKKDMLLWYKFA